MIAAPLLGLAALTLPALLACGPAPKGGDGDAGDDSGGVDTGAGPPARGPSPYTLDEVLRLTDAQALGTHNSYHLRSDRLVDPSHDYDHAPLDVQLEEQGVRQFELDLHLHASLGWQVFHLPGDVDEGTTCLALADCLGTILAWSDRNPWHLPLTIWLEPKDEDLDWAIPELEQFVDRHDELERAILDVIPAARIFTPDELRGEHPDLPTALAAEGWPTLGALRGRFLFAMLDSDNHRAAYLAGAPALQGRLMFVDADTPADPFAATFKINNAVADAALVAEVAAAGMLVTSNIDGAGSDDAEAQASLEGSLAAGAHLLSTDYPAPVPERAYFAQIPGGTPARCNPLTAPAACTPNEIEDLARARALAAEAGR
jgi:hypothetical protein